MTLIGYRAENRDMTPMTLERHYEWNVLAVPSAVGLLRDYATSALVKWGLEERVDDTVLVVSELVTNAVDPRAARGREITFALTRTDEGIAVEVTDPARGRPQRRDAAMDDTGGRGLAIVEFLAAEYGYHDLAGGGKTVWARLTG